eukprot:24532-Eustigmatos_ZCMA.PRE.1
MINHETEHSLALDVCIDGLLRDAQWELLVSWRLTGTFRPARMLNAQTDTHAYRHAHTKQTQGHSAKA